MAKDKFPFLIDLLNALQNGDWELHECTTARPNLRVIDGEDGERVFHPDTETVITAVFRLRCKLDG